MTSNEMTPTGWRVMVGMVDTRAHVVRDVDEIGGKWWWWNGFGRATLTTKFEPDMSHPATVGCCLAIVRELWNWDVYVERLPEGWRVVCPDLGKDGALMGELYFHGDTEGEALAVARDAAPTKVETP